MTNEAWTVPTAVDKDWSPQALFVKNGGSAPSCETKSNWPQRPDRPGAAFSIPYKTTDEKSWRYCFYAHAWVPAPSSYAKARLWLKKPECEKMRQAHLKDRQTDKLLASLGKYQRRRGPASHTTASWSWRRSRRV